MVDDDNFPLYWHTPAGRSAGFLPDSSHLWSVFWKHRGSIKGFAHTHPGGGPSGPSSEDLSTFAAIESALGMKLKWWIVTRDRVVLFEAGDLMVLAITEEPNWVATLRQLSEDFVEGKEE